VSHPAEPALRTFVALELDASVRAAVADYLATLRSVPGVAWARPENLHLTLKFLGNVATARLPALTERLAAATATLPSFVMHVAGVGAFPNLARPRILWVGCEAAPLGALATAVDAACVRAGFAAEARAFHPHVTLGRIREPGRRDRFPFLATDGGRTFGSSAVAAIVLFASKLGSGGARYTPLATIPLAAA
jgi:RNA 2',3'-cyclic 3'-phosphodiesterase